MKPFQFYLYICFLTFGTIAYSQEPVDITSPPEVQNELQQKYPVQTDVEFKSANNVTGHTKPIRSVAISPDNRWIYTAGTDGKAKKWNALKNEVVLTFDGHYNELFSIDVSPGGDKLVTSSRDGEARVWDTNTGKMLHRIKCGDGIAWDSTFSPDGKTAAVASHDRMVRIWDTNNAEIIHVLPSTLYTYSCAFSKNTNLLVSGHHAAVVVWDTSTGKELKHFKVGGHENYLHAIAVSPDGKTIAVGGLDKTITMIDLVNDNISDQLGGHTGFINSVHFSDDGNYILSTARNDRNVFLWDLTSNKSKTVFTCISGANDAVFSDDGKFIVVAMNHSVVIFDRKSNRAVREINIQAHR